jgi:hypothetical protein
VKAAVSLLLAIVALGACAGVRNVSLEELATEQEQLAGETVRTSGIVRRFTDPDGAPYYVLEDAADNRVLLSPPDAVARYEGQALAVVGTFEVSATLGRLLHVQSLAAAED